MSKEIKRIDIKEFREKGYLQEVNRRFFHPLGLALEVEISKEGVERLGGVWDYRDDPEGVHYDLKKSDDERLARFTKNKDYIDSQLKLKSQTREESLGYSVEPVLNDKK